MKQVLQSLRTGETMLADIPCPQPGAGQVLVRTGATLVSAGTERMLVEFGKAGWLEKARQQPHKVRMVLDKIRADGLMPTVDAVLNKLDQPMPLGYCNVGTVMEAGAGVTQFVAGDRVVSSGKHAEAVIVPVNLCAKVPEGVPDEEAAFTVVAAIGLQGIRLAQPTLGETVVVTGLGLIGLLTVQLLRAHGCRVLGIDFAPERLALARSFGAEVVDLGAGEDPVEAAQAYSRGRGVDAVIITASSKSNEPVHQAALMCRKRGRIVLVGVTGLELAREDFYTKELTFQVSCSFGPGRYDPAYEEHGLDYPLAFVRWTEQRNFEAVLDMMADKRLRVAPLVSHRYPIAEARAAYEVVGGAAPSLGILLEYPAPAAQHESDLRQARITLRVEPAVSTAAPALGFIGAGNYASAVLIPAFKAAGARLKVVASSGGVSAIHAGRKFGFEAGTTDTAGVLADTGVDGVVVTTRHDSHARLVCEALSRGKHVFVEKPLALTLDELAQIAAAQDAHARAPLVMVGFNRRFAPHVQKIASLLTATPGPKAFVMTVNAGAIPAEHWTQDARVGGGRIAGEACHFIDLLRFLAGAPIASHRAWRMSAPTADTATIQLTFTDGSIGTVHYFANGARAFPKERLEVFAAGRILQLDNFRTLQAWGWPGFRHMRLWRQDKGQSACAAAFVQAIRQNAPSPIPIAELLEVSRVSIEAARLLE